MGAVLLMVAGLIVGYVPLQFTMELILIGGPFTAIGLLFAVLIFLTGVFALLRPDLSTILGIAGVAFSILSVVGALGGLLIGLLIGIVGSNLLIAWQPPGTREEPIAPPGGAGTGTEPTTTGTDFSRFFRMRMMSSTANVSPCWSETDSDARIVPSARTMFALAPICWPVSGS